MKKLLAGFTLIELLIVVAIVAIVAAVAVPSYNSYVLKSRRSDGVNSILSLSLAEERYRSSNTTYGSLAQIGGSTSSSQGYYTLSISGVSGTGYTITATAVGGQASDTENNASCSTLSLTSSSGTISKSPTGCWPT